MEYDLIYPERQEEMFDAPCIVAAVYFVEDELIGFGVPKNSIEIQEPFWTYNEFQKPFELWASPKFLSDYYDRNKEYFEQEYWADVSEDDFLSEVTRSIDYNKDELVKKMESNEFYSLVEPLDENEDAKRLCESIKIKIKQGVIKGRYPFRFYAIEIEEEKCYLITGATIKVHKDMRKAKNTIIELRKLEAVSKVLLKEGVDTKDTFIDFFIKENVKNKP